MPLTMTAKQASALQGNTDKPAPKRARKTDPTYDKELLLNTMLEQAKRLGIELPAFHKELQFAKYFNQKYRFDVCWILSKLAVEFDGHGHKRHYQWMSDTKKSQWASALGWRIMRVTEKQLLDDPEPFFECLLMALKECCHPIPHWDKVSTKGEV